MERSLLVIKKTRDNWRRLMESVPEEKWTEIPKGFQNSLEWNLGHSVVTTSLLAYGLCDLQIPVLPTEVIEKYRKGSKASEVGMDWGNWMDQTVSTLALDRKTKPFLVEKPYETSFGVKLSNIEEVIHFLSVHEGIHFGYALALKKSLL